MDRRIDRRSFLRLVGATTASAAFPATPGASRWQLRMSTSSIHFKELPIEEAVARIAGMGFEAVDIWSAHDGCPHLDDVAQRLGPNGLKALLFRNKLRLFAFSVYQGGYERYAELLGKAGGGVAVRGSAGPCSPAELQTRMRRFLRDLSPLIDLAERYDSFLAIENHGNALLDSLDSIKAFVEINTSPRLGIALAPYHLQARGASVPEAIHTCGKQLFFFYAWQRRPGIEQLPGVGPTDMVPWIRALADIEYTGYANPFMHGHPGVDVLTTNLARARAYMEDSYGSAIEPG
jgi:sugar phosphate isomerase/epimerase